MKIIRNRLIVVAGTILLLLQCHVVSAAENPVHPSKIPYFDSFSCPIFVPGDAGVFSFKLTNRYAVDMKNVSLIMEVYEHLTLESSELVKDMSNPPRMQEYKEGTTEYLVPIGLLAKGTNTTISRTIQTSKDTPDGTYVMRMKLDFVYNGTRYLMLSRSYFSDFDWNYATSTGKGQTGEINMTYLKAKYNCDAIIPDTSFAVKTPIPIWPLFVLIGLAAFFGILAVVFYLQEERGMFPRLEKALQKWSGKYQEERRLLKKRLR